ncbi:BgTH12-00755 [Blumeria graminis f. sp. triticale]|uniref:Bgt-3009 n=3 Tax=Blumeria graminis TaxID=34373 RepID=A0A381LDV1_BLUGR|nr:Low-affinity zinc transporter [Blumeria graminis f. sp. tritici 96224]CAD6505263.1 BgTH12-00755 [Blumeria graminis f. sp. triticale]VDB93273.1 Bgt-3009 [Blumeria graminis f. sp. tritici]
MDQVDMQQETLWPRITSNGVHLIGRTKRHGMSMKLQCGSISKAKYDTSIHLFALILILILSTLACAFPLISRKASSSARSGKFIFISQHFGTGVLIATAFVHLLPTAFGSLTDPCLTSFFNEKFPSLAGLVAMISLFVVVGLEMFLTARGAKHTHSTEVHNIDSENEERHAGNLTPSWRETSTGQLKKKFVRSLRPRELRLEDVDASAALVDNASPLPDSTPVTAQSNRNQYSGLSDDQDSDVGMDEIGTSITPPLGFEESSKPPIVLHHLSNSSCEALRKRQVMQCLMLEAGILFHSIFIGMAVSVATGPSFLVFLSAIGLHQTFEGIALGSRIAAIDFPSRALTPWFMVLAFGITTPLGQAIGIVVHNLYDPHSAGGLLMVGFMNGISSGLLLYAGLVQLLAEDFLSDRSFKVLHGKQRIQAFASVLAGALLMTLVGVWA